MSHQQRGCSHDENRLKICAVCFGKSKYNITKVVEERIIMYFHEDFVLSDPRYPAGICAKCRNDLLNISCGKKTVAILPELYDCDQISPVLTSTRANPIPLCDCKLCDIARRSGNLTLLLRKKGRPSTKEKAPSVPITICSECKSEYGRGIAHKCNTKTLRHNMMEMMHSSDTNTQEVIASGIVKNSAGEDFSCKLYSGGPKPFTVYLKNPAQSPQLKLSEITQLQTATSSSNNEIRRKFVPFIRNIFGRKSVESHVGLKLPDRDRDCVDYFDCIPCNFECTPTEDGDSNNTSNLVYCTDVEGLIDLICERRRFDKHSVNIKMGIDSGGGCLKFCLNIISKTSSDSTMPKKLIQKTMLDTSVKRLIIIAVAYNVKETHANIRLIFEHLKIDEIDIDYMCAVDLKMANILCGLQSHSCTYPCVYCECPKSEFSDPMKFKSYRMRTIGEIKQLADQFVRSRKLYNVNASAKDFKNCVCHPMIQGNDSDILIQKIPLPELHLLLRIVNKIFKELQATAPKESEEWLAKIGIVQPKLHGGEFTGNMCRRLLKHVPCLQVIGQTSPRHTSLIEKVSAALAAFDDVVTQCFGQNLHPEYEESIKIFQEAYLKIGISTTTAAHIVFVHLIQFCKYKKCSLGSYSEQASEAVHSDFDKMWISAGKVSENNEKFPNRLLSCVVRYNSRHF